MHFRKPSNLVFGIPQNPPPWKTFLCDLLEIPLKVHCYFQLKLCWPCNRWCCESSSSQVLHVLLSLQSLPGCRAGKSRARWALQFLAEPHFLLYIHFFCKTVLPQSPLEELILSAWLFPESQFFWLKNHCHVSLKECICSIFCFLKVVRYFNLPFTYSRPQFLLQLCLNYGVMWRFIHTIGV